MSDVSKAVFLSYASLDADATRRICEALRAAGIEVWFDQSELRGGDAWDHKIRQQIRDCALFVPIISENTQTRSEGYFRLEWDLADQRSHMIAHSKAFIVPVCVDATADKGAVVPESFLKVQWTRVPGGEASGGFCERVKMLMGGEVQTASASAKPLPMHSVVPPKRPLRRMAVALAAAVVAVGIAGVVWRWMAAPRVSVPTVPPVAATAASAVPEKSIAVLPFVDMSEKHDQEYFSDGLSEEIIDHLAHAPNLRVIARTSSFQFKGKNEDMRTIAAQLGVANLLEGSVRKAGIELRITAQLIRASDGSHLWSLTYKRRLEDIFKVQDEIAGAVTKALNVVLHTTSRPESAINVGPEAYSLYLQGNYFLNRFHSGDTEKAIDSFKQAVRQYSNYAEAWANLSHAYIIQGISGERPATEARSLALDAATRAVMIEPSLAIAHRQLGTIAYRCDRNWAMARAEYAEAINLDPIGESGRGSGMNEAMLTATLTGHVEELIAVCSEILLKDPLDPAAHVNLAINLEEAGRLGDAVGAWRKLLEMDPQFRGAYSGYAGTLLLQGNFDGAIKAALMEPDELQKQWVLAAIYWSIGRHVDSESALAKVIKVGADSNAYSIASLYAERGDINAAFRWLDRAIKQNDVGLEDIKSDLSFRNVRSDARYKGILRKMNLPET